MYYVIVSLIIAMALIGIFIITIYNKIQFVILKIAEAENNMDALLTSKIDLLKRMQNVLKDQLPNEKNIFSGLESFSPQSMNNFELNKKLSNFSKELNDLLDAHEELSHHEPFYKIMEDFQMNRDEIVAMEHFYNDNVVLYNHFIKAFPSNFICGLFHFKEKNFYSEEKEEIYKILENQTTNRKESVTTL